MRIDVAHLLPAGLIWLCRRRFFSGLAAAAPAIARTFWGCAAFAVSGTGASLQVNHDTGYNTASNVLQHNNVLRACDCAWCDNARRRCFNIYFAGVVCTVQGTVLRKTEDD